MARTPPQGKRREKTGTAADQGPTAAGPAAFSVQEAVATEAASALPPMSTGRTGDSRRMAGNARPRPAPDNAHGARASGHENPAAADQETPFAAPESSAIGNLRGREEAVTSEIAAAPFQTNRRLQGHIDAVDWAAVNGWVWDPNTPGKRIRLELVDGETALVTTIAKDHRPELVKRGIGDGGYGFSIEFPNEMLAEGRHTLHLRCADSGATVPGSPINFDSTGLAETPDAMTELGRQPSPQRGSAAR